MLFEGGSLDKDQYKIKVEYGVAAVVILIGLFFIYQATTIGVSKEAVGPRTVPMFLAVSLVVGGLWIALIAFLGKTAHIKGAYGFQESDVRRIFQVIGCGCLFLFLFWGFGYFVALIITFVAMLFTFGVRSWPKMGTSAVFLALVFQWLFMGIMRLNDPKGAIVNLRPYIAWITGE